jgi:hypothetical protein
MAPPDPPLRKESFLIGNAGLNVALSTSEQGGNKARYISKDAINASKFLQYIRSTASPYTGGTGPD